MKTLRLPTQPAQKTTQPWIRSAWFDGVFILSPPFLALVVVALLPVQFRTSTAMPVVAWVGLVVLVDVAHVYSTLFRTYFDGQRRRQRATLFWVVPLGCYLAGVALHYAGSLVFWRMLAYLAVFHFIRQQYGFLRLYARQEPRTATSWLDTVVIYAATLYPLLYWHLSPPRNFNWFINGDFVQRDWPTGRLVLMVAYVGLMLLYVAKETAAWYRAGVFNLPRNLLIIGTAVSWYFGIVYFNGDLAFTLLNVVSHGIPYLALVWSSSQPATTGRGNRSRPWWGGRYGVALFLGVVALLAYAEEGLWDGFVWREHGSVFSWFQQLPTVADPLLLTLLVPLLALPQMTHYVLDGFIWRRGQ